MGSNETLVLKLVLTPLVVGGASLAARRWGSEIGGWIVGIPFTSAPIAFFLALGPGPHFAVEASIGILAGTASQAAFALGYSWASRRAGWAACLGAGTVAFAAITAALLLVRTGPLLAFLGAVSALVIAFALMPRRLRSSAPVTELPGWDIPMRAVLATLLVVGLTEAAPFLGPRLAGLLAPFPLYASVLAVFSHRAEGADSAVRTLRGLLLGLFAFAGFFLSVAILLEPRGIAVAFAVATAVALILQATSLAIGRRLAIA